VTAGREMRTVEDVERALGLEPKTQARLGGGCSHNPSQEDDPSQDCGKIPLWHVKLRSEDENAFYPVLACEEHLARLLVEVYKDTVLDRHEYGSACGLERSWWIRPIGEAGSFCVTEERGVEMGFLRYVDIPTEGSQ
jgi:hypothetical protein